MKNRELLNMWGFINQIHISKICKSIKSTKFQWWFDRNVKKMQSEVKAVYDALDILKPDEFKKAITEKNNAEINRLAIEFEQKQEVIDLFDIETEFELKKVKLLDLPEDLKGDEMEAIGWMIEE